MDVAVNTMDIADTIREISGHLNIRDATRMMRTCRIIYRSLNNEDWWRSRVAGDHNIDTRPSDVDWRTHCIGIHRNPGWSFVARGDRGTTLRPIEQKMVKMGVPFQNRLVGISSSGILYTIHTSGRCTNIYTCSKGNGFINMFTYDGLLRCVSGKRMYIWDYEGYMLKYELDIHVVDMNDAYMLNRQGGLWSTIIDNCRIDIDVKIVELCDNICLDEHGDIYYLSGCSATPLLEGLTTKILYKGPVYLYELKGPVYLYTLDRTGALYAHGMDLTGDVKIVRSKVLFNGVRRASVNYYYICVIDDDYNLWRSSRTSLNFTKVDGIKAIDVKCLDMHIMVKGGYLL